MKRILLLALVLAAVAGSAGSSVVSSRCAMSCDVAAPSDLFVGRVNPTKNQIEFVDNTEGFCPVGVGFEIERSDDGGDFFLLKKARRAAFEWENPVVVFDYSAPAGVAYCYRVKAVTETEVSDYSETACE